MMNSTRWLRLVVALTVWLAGGIAHATITANPSTGSPVAIGNVVVGQTGMGSLTVSSDQTGGEVVATFDLSACSLEFAVSTGTPLTVPKSPGTATINVTFTPAARETGVSCTVTMRDALNTALGTFQITGSGIAPVLQITTTTPVNFGSVRVLDTATKPTNTVNVVLKNNTTDVGQNLSITALAISGTNAADYTITSPTTFPQSITPGSTMNVTVVFNPSAAGTRSGSLDITSNDPVNGMQSAALTGTGTNAVIAVTDPINFGIVPDNTALSQSIAVSNSAPTNPGTLTLTTASITQTMGWFTFTGGLGGLGCVAGATSCTFTAGTTAPANVAVTCKPPAGATGTQTATVTINSDTDAGGTNVSNLSCTAGRPVVMVSASSLSFGNQLVNTTSTAMSFTVSNTGNENLTFWLNNTGTVPLQFSATVMGSACGTSATNLCTLAGGTSATVNVVFKPTTPGDKAATLVVTTNDPTTPNVNVLLSGHCTAPAISPSANPIAYGNVEVGASSTKTLTVTNTGDATLTISNAALSGAADYTVTNGLVGVQTTAIAPGGTASWDIKCAPMSQGLKSGTFTVSSDAFPSPNTLTVNLTCTGLQGVLALAPTSFNFNGVRIGDVTSHGFTLSNTGNVAVNTITCTLSNMNVGYSITTPTFPIASIAAGASATITVQFAPMQATDGGNVTLSCTGSWGAVPTPTTATSAISGAALVAGYDTVPKPTLDFGNVRYDQTVTMPVQVINTATDSTTQVKITAATIVLGTAMSSEITIASCTHNSVAVTCPSSTTPFTLTGMNDTLVINVKCAPAARVAMLTASLDLNSDLGTNPTRTVNITANSVAGMLAVTPGTNVLDFGAVDIDAGAVMQSITIANTATAAGATLDLSAAVVGGANAARFQFSSLAATTVQPAGMSTFTVTYTPNVERPGPCPANCDVATLTWTVKGDCNGTNCTTMPVTVMIYGRGIDRHISVAPAPTFPDTFRNPGTAAPVEPVMVTNTGEATLRISAVMLTNGPIWTVLNPDPIDVPGNSQYAFMVQFAPISGGKAPDGQMVIVNNDNGMPMVMMTMMGNGLNRNVDMTPPIIDLGYTGIGIPVTLSKVAPSALLTVSNLDPSNTFTIRSIDVDDPAFTIIDSPTGLALAPSAMQQFDITFTPDHEGDYEATANLYLDQDPVSQQPVTLRGHAVFADAKGGGGCQTGRGSGGGVLVIVGAMVAALRRRRRVLLAALLVAGVVGTAFADDGRNLDLTVFNPTPQTTGEDFQLQAPGVGASGAWVLTGLVSYANNPLVIDTAQNNDAAVQNRTTFSLGGAFAFLDRFEAGAQMPLYLQSGQAMGDPTMSFGVPPADGTARGDLMVHGKAQLWRGPAMGGDFIAGAGLSLTLPTATSGQFAGVTAPEGRALVLASLAPGEGRLAITLNAGGVLREKVRFANIAQGSGVVWGVGASYRVLDELAATAEAFGDVIPSGRYTSPTSGASTLATIEALGGVRYQMERRLNVGVAVGRGVTTGIGSPDMRGVVLITLAPTAPEPPPRPRDMHDSDGDGIPDDVDKCPNEPEDRDMFQDEDGCPDPDNDHDGIPDAVDKCPLDPEDKDGFQDEDGCPDKDNDNDGIPDDKDKCPNEPEDKDGYQDLDGCPDPDNDGDGIPDAKDKCPNEPETINGIQDDDGCPDRGDSLVVLSPDRLDLLESIQFSGTKLAKSSFNVLGQVAATLRAHPEIVRVRVTAHVQPSSDSDRDQEISDKRAAAVRDWLVQWGIAPNRLEARGFGGNKPLVSPDQKGASLINNRLELIILERK